MKKAKITDHNVIPGLGEVWEQIKDFRYKDALEKAKKLPKGSLYACFVFCLKNFATLRDRVGELDSDVKEKELIIMKQAIRIESYDRKIKEYDSFLSDFVQKIYDISGIKPELERGDIDYE